MRTDARRAAAVVAAAAAFGFGCRCRPAPAARAGAGRPCRCASATPGPEASSANVKARASLPPTPIAVTPCPVSAATRTADPQAVLDQAIASYDKGRYSEAFTCADIASDSLPESVDVQHIRAAALAALGRFREAESGFAMALAIDPDDPQTLAAAADFYINILPHRRRENSLVGLAYARRGSAQAADRGHRDPDLRARLVLLQAEAEDDLGRADLALPLADQALAIEPGMVDAVHERGVSLFNQCRFDDAKAAFLAEVSAVPASGDRDPYAHQYLGLIYERAGDEADAKAEFARAHALSGGEISTPVPISRAGFRAEVEKAIAELPPERRALLEGVAIETPDLPALADLTAVDPPFAPTILGLFRGLPLAAGAAPAQRGVPARAIILYRKNLARAARTRAALNAQIRRTLEHEMGHLTGLSESDLRRRGLE